MERLPIIYSHEHMAIDLSGPKQDQDCNLNVYQEALDEIKVLKELGVCRIIDCSNHGIGRDVSVIKKIMEECGIEIMVSTGFYKDPFLPSDYEDKTQEELVDELLHDINVGMDGIKATWIGEIGTSLNTITKNEEKLFKVAAKVHKLSGVPIITHTTLGTMGLEQIAIFKEYQVDLSKVIISHVALKKDFDYIVSLLETGVNIAFDTIGKLSYQSDEIRAEWIKKLVDLGYQKQMVISMDITRKSHLKKYGGVGYAYLIEIFIPLLIKRGVSLSALRDMNYHNILRILQEEA